jgi:DNA-binding transcriptional regulator GbsR (MarR family)
MDLPEAKQQFISSWGALGSTWGVSKTMAQIHALLLVSPKPLDTETVMGDLNISRGNVNMNLRALIDWGLVEKINLLGERREFFQAEKDIWKVAMRIAAERRKRELQPILRILDQVDDIEDKSASPEEIREFKKVISGLSSFTKKTDKVFNKLTTADENWFTGTLIKMMR